MKRLGLAAVLFMALAARGARNPAVLVDGADSVPAPASVAASEPASSSVDFASDVAPILSRCRPCHYPGGVMHSRMPFDDPDTVRKTGEKLFTRIKDEKDRAVLRRFFASAH